MTVINRRNAVIGWGTMLIARRVLRRKLPEPEPRWRRRSFVGGASLLVISAAGAAVVWRLRAGGSGDE
jgi:ferric-dicitrate binding protein FerR (iron transport regulator)